MDITPFSIPLLQGWLSLILKFLFSLTFSETPLCCVCSLLSFCNASLPRARLHLFYDLVLAAGNSSNTSLSLLFLTPSSSLSAFPWVSAQPSCASAPQLDTALQMHLTSAKQKGIITSLNLLTTLVLTQPRRQLAFIDARHPANSCSSYCPPEANISHAAPNMELFKTLVFS